MRNRVISLVILMILTSCSQNVKEKASIDEDQLGFISADVSSEETNLIKKALVAEIAPGHSEKIERAFENAPPLIPHTTTGFFPITIKSNICLSCHIPEKAKEIDGVPLPETHFVNLRPEIVDEGGILKVPEDEGVNHQKLEDMNQAYYNCSQCHVPQTEITAHIENHFTPEFRDEFGLEKSNLEKKLEEGIK